MLHINKSYYIIYKHTVIKQKYGGVDQISVNLVGRALSGSDHIWRRMTTIKESHKRRQLNSNASVLEGFF